MQTVADRPEAPTAIRTDLGAIFVSLELSRSTWLITSLSPGGGEKMSKQVVRGGDVAELLERFARLREKARARTGKVFPFVVIQEAGLDGFWIDRALQNEGIESHVVDPASIATSRRRLVQDNLNIHGKGSLYEAFPAAEARRLVERFEWHYTPKHGSWLDLAESELGVLTSQCLDRRIADKQTLVEEIAAWEHDRNANHTKANWQFSTPNARIKLKHLYPAI